MPILAGLASGAGLLARGVANLFSGKTAEERQAKRAERLAARQMRRAERRGVISPDIPEVPVDIARVTADQIVGAPPGKPFDISEMFKKYWWVLLIVVLLFTPMGKKLLGTNPGRRAPRRRPAKPKTIIRYRTRKAPARKR